MSKALGTRRAQRRARRARLDCAARETGVKRVDAGAPKSCSPVAQQLPRHAPQVRAPCARAGDGAEHERDRPRVQQVGAPSAARGNMRTSSGFSLSPSLPPSLPPSLLPSLPPPPSLPPWFPPSKGSLSTWRSRRASRRRSRCSRRACRASCGVLGSPNEVTARRALLSGAPARARSPGGCEARAALSRTPIVSPSLAQVVLGPALLALTHLALHPQCRNAIVDAGGLKPLVICVRLVAAPPVLVHACKCVAAIALDAECKVRIAGADGGAALVELLGEPSAYVCRAARARPPLSRGEAFACLPTDARGHRACARPRTPRSATCCTTRRRTRTCSSSSRAGAVRERVQREDAFVIEGAARASATSAYHSTYCARQGARAPRLRRHLLRDRLRRPRAGPRDPRECLIALANLATTR